MATTPRRLYTVTFADGSPARYIDSTGIDQICRHLFGNLIKVRPTSALEMRTAIKAGADFETANEKPADNKPAPGAPAAQPVQQTAQGELEADTGAAGDVVDADFAEVGAPAGQHEEVKLELALKTEEQAEENGQEPEPEPEPARVRSGRRGR